MERSGSGAGWGTPESDSGTWEASGRLREKRKNQVGCKKMLERNKIRRFGMGNRNTGECGVLWGLRLPRHGGRAQR